MMDTEKLMPLADAAKIALGFDKHKSTIYRWATKGVRGASGRRVFLNYRRIGGELMCTIQDVREFDEAIRTRSRPRIQGRIHPRSEPRSRPRIQIGSLFISLLP